MTREGSHKYLERCQLNFYNAWRSVVTSARENIDLATCWLWRFVLEDLVRVICLIRRARLLEEYEGAGDVDKSSSDVQFWPPHHNNGSLTHAEGSAVVRLETLRLCVVFGGRSCLNLMSPPTASIGVRALALPTMGTAK